MFAVRLDDIDDKETFRYTTTLYTLPYTLYSTLTYTLHMTIIHSTLDFHNTLLKLHRQFAHPPEATFVTLLKDAGAWQNDYQAIVSDIYMKCSLCKCYRKTPARPAVDLPMASQFNQLVSMDLKKWKNRYILHLVDM